VRSIPVEAIDFFFSIYLILPATLGHEVYLAFNRNEYEKQKKMFLERKARPVDDNLPAICETIF
jgi:hypothetical protein